jgi:membrane protein DedA with SNARE-associated domain
VEHFLEHFGYLAVLFGSFLEGETVVVVAGYAARRGYLSLSWVILAAFFGSVAGDQLWFYLGRRYGPAIFKRYPALSQKAERVNNLLYRRGTIFVLFLRFMYGIRIAGPIVIGVTRYPARRFLLLNLLGGMLWAPIIAGAGYVLGHGVEIVLGDIRRYEIWFLVLMGALGAGVWGVRRLRRSRRRNVASSAATTDDQRPVPGSPPAPEKTRTINAAVQD